MNRLRPDSLSVVSRDVSMEYGDQKVLDLREGGDITIGKGITVINGPSGSGKSTWLNIMAGFVTPTTGEIKHINESSEIYSNSREASAFKRALTSVAHRLIVQTRSEGRESDYRSDAVGYISQQPALHPELSMGRYISLTHEVRNNKLDEAYVSSLISRLGLANLLEKKPTALSGGEEQRGAIVAALAHQPQIIFADEPTSALDRLNKVNTMQILRESADEGSTVVVVSHDPEALDFADRTITLNEGKIE